MGLVKNTCWAIVDKLGQIFAWTCAETPRAAEMRCVAVRGVDGWNETRESQGLQPVLVELVRTAPPCEAHAPASALWAARNRVGTRLDGYVEIFRGRPRMTPTGYWSEARHGCSWVARVHHSYLPQLQPGEVALLRPDVADAEPERRARDGHD